MAGNYGIFCIGGRNEFLKWGASFDLFERADCISAVFKMADCVDCAGEVVPLNGEFGSEGGFVYLVVGRCGAYAAKYYAFHKECVGCAENCSDVGERPDVVEHNDKGEFATGAILLQSVAPEVLYCLFFQSYQFMIEKPVYFCRHSGTRIPSGVWLFSRRAAIMRGRASAEPLRVWQR